jgi:DNA (cytosine-5)-methyltransferase 1
MDTYVNKTRNELILICKEQKIKNYSSLNKDELIKLILFNNQVSVSIPIPISNVQTETNVSVCDFFCGAGGFSEGFYQEGFDVVFALDYWKPAYITHEHNHKNCKNVCMNILDIDSPEKMDEIIPDTIIIIGSPPCVSFSSSNLSGKEDKALGLKLIKQFLKIVLYKKSKPNSKLKYWIMENVPNSIEFIKDKYTAQELDLDPSFPDLVINNKNILIASNYGSPQGRKRAIVGDYIVPEITHSTSNNIHVSKILEALGSPLNNLAQTISDPSFPLILAKHDVTDHFYDSEIPNEWVVKAKRLKTDHGFMGKMDFPDRTDRLCRTIMATESYCSRESIIFKKEDCLNKYRAPTIRELACLMGFPIDYQFVGTNSNSKHKQIGNAVCVHMSMALAKAIKIHMNIQLEKKPRMLVKATINLNDLKCPLFSKYKLVPKKMNSKFHIHIPNLKINQLRVELDNITSDFDKSQYIWRCVLHKGSGKHALSVQFDNNKLVPLICNHKLFEELTNFININIKPYVYSSYKFQEKNCNIVNENNETHYSPCGLLELIANKITELAIKDEKIEIAELDIILNYVKKNTYSMETICALYILNAVVAYLNLNVC